MNLLEEGLRCWRSVDGSPLTNIPAPHRHHSTMGIEWGYAGSGPADLALNVLAALLPGNDVMLWGGSRVSNAAMALHQAFRDAFLVSMPREGGAVPAEALRAWLARHSSPQTS